MHQILTVKTVIAKKYFNVAEEDLFKPSSKFGLCLCLRLIGLRGLNWHNHRCRHASTCCILQLTQFEHPFEGLLVPWFTVQVCTENVLPETCTEVKLGRRLFVCFVSSKCIQMIPFHSYLWFLVYLRRRGKDWLFQHFPGWGEEGQVHTVHAGTN